MYIFDVFVKNMYMMQFIMDFAVHCHGFLIIFLLINKNICLDFSDSHYKVIYEKRLNVFFIFFIFYVEVQ